MIEPRVAPLESGELSAVQRKFLEPFTNARGHYPNLFGVLCRNMPLMQAWLPFGLFTMSGAQTDPILREVLILRTSELSNCAYERHHHQRIASMLGITELRLKQIRTGEVTGDIEHDLMIRCANELAETTRLSDPTWADMISLFGLETTLDSIFTVGAYTALAMGLNSCGVEIEGRKTS